MATITATPPETATTTTLKKTCSKKACHGRTKIEKLAYHKWEVAGRPQSDGVEFWLAAECELTTSEVTITPIVE
jgi:hypothetical protein